MKPTKIVHLITELHIGGAQKALAQLLRHINLDKFEPVVVCLYGGDGSVADEIRELGVQVVDLGMVAKWRLDAFWRLFQLLRQERPDILHTWLFHANLPGRLLGLFAGVPIVINSEHSSGMESEWRYRLNYWTSGLTDAIVVVSENVRDFFSVHVGLPNNKLTLIYNGITIQEHSRIEARTKLGIAENVPVVGTVARLDPVKGIHVLIEAMAHLPDDVRLVIIGDGTERAKLETLAHKIGISERVMWMGYQQNVPIWLPGIDVYVQPSLYEGQSITIIEAMAAQLPVVATTVGGIPEVVSDGETGLLVPSSDPVALAEAISKLLDDADMRQRMGQAGANKVHENFTVKQMVQHYERLYQQLINEKIVM